MKKKALAFVLSTALCFGATLPVFAAEDAAGVEKDVDTSNLKSNDDTATHTYKAYQIFTGKYQYDKDGNIRFINVEFGSSFATLKANLDTKFAELGIEVKDFNENGTVGDAADYAAAFEKLNNAGAEAVAQAIYTAVKDTDGTAVIKDGDRHKIDAGEGYYLIIDASDFSSEGEDALLYLDRAQLQRVYANGVVAINSKHTEIESHKKVKDANDSYEGEVEVSGKGWEKSADYDLGDVIPFQLSATVPEDFANYTEYEYIFHDVQDEALVFNKDSVKVSVDGNEITKGYEVRTENIGEDTFQIYFADLKMVPGLTATSEIVVNYTSTLSGEKIKYGNEVSQKFQVPGNPNKMRVTFDNKQGGKGKTPWDIVIVFTFKTNVFKIDQDRKPLNGAQFELKKYIKETNSWEVVQLFTMSSQEQDTEILDQFTAKGIDDGKYWLTETVVPAGYNKAPDVKFEVIAVHTDMVTKVKVIDSETGDVLGSSDNDEHAASLGTFTINAQKSDIDEKIINQKGAILPSTGGIGTTIFYIIGGVLVVGAVVLLIVRRKMRTEEE